MGAARGHSKPERKSDEDPSSPSPPFPPPPVPLHNQSRCLEPIDVRVWCMAENSWQQYCWDNAPSINEALHMECSAWSQFSFSRTEWKCEPLKRPSDPLQSLCTLNNGTQSVGTTFERAKHLQEGLHRAQNYSLGLHGSIIDRQENKNLNSKKYFLQSMPHNTKCLKQPLWNDLFITYLKKMNKASVGEAWNFRGFYKMCPPMHVKNMTRARFYNLSQRASLCGFLQTTVVVHEHWQITEHK